MRDKAIESITLSDIEKLIDEGIQEGKFIEYKRETYRLAADDRDFRKKQQEELLKDVSSFANTVGGHLILGVEEEKGVPINVCGIECDDPDRTETPIHSDYRAGTRTKDQRRHPRNPAGRKQMGVRD